MGGGSSSYEVETTCTSIDTLGSQGIFRSRDEICSMQHKSTVPKSYYQWKYGIEGGMNMDRGGFGSIKRKKGNTPSSIFACAFDGVSHGGKINAYASQSFAEHCIKELQHQNLQYLKGSNEQKDFWEHMFCRLQDNRRNPGNVNGEHEAGGGAATAVAISLHPTPTKVGSWVLNGAGIGDAAVILINGETLEGEQLNRVSRRDNSYQDSGGQLEMCKWDGIDSRDLSEFDHVINEGDVILLTTDGVTDNISDIANGTKSKILPYILCNPSFDSPLTKICPWSNICPTCSPIPEEVKLCICFGENIVSEEVKNSEVKLNIENERGNEAKATGEEAKHRPHLPSLAELQSYFPGVQLDDLSDVRFIYEYNSLFIYLYMCSLSHFIFQLNNMISDVHGTTHITLITLISGCSASSSGSSESLCELGVRFPPTPSTHLISTRNAKRRRYQTN